MGGACSHPTMFVCWSTITHQTGEMKRSLSVDAKWALLNLVIVTQREAGVYIFPFAFLRVLTQNQKTLAEPPKAPHS